MKDKLARQQIKDLHGGVGGISAIDCPVCKCLRAGLKTGITHWKERQRDYFTCLYCDASLTGESRYVVEVKKPGVDTLTVDSQSFNNCSLM